MPVSLAPFIYHNQNHLPRSTLKDKHMCSRSKPNIASSTWARASRPGWFGAGRANSDWPSWCLWSWACKKHIDSGWKDQLWPMADAPNMANKASKEYGTSEQLCVIETAVTAQTVRTEIVWCSCSMDKSEWTTEVIDYIRRETKFISASDWTTTFCSENRILNKTRTSSLSSKENNHCGVPLPKQKHLMSYESLGYWVFASQVVSVPFKAAVQTLLWRLKRNRCRGPSSRNPLRLQSIDTLIWVSFLRVLVFGWFQRWANRKNTILWGPPNNDRPNCVVGLLDT